jgi:hypothetical protein
MYRIALEGGDTVIRIKRELVNQGTVPINRVERQFSL